jgi:hypothetical protein
MMLARATQEEASTSLGNKGLAMSVTPPESTMEPWSRLVLTVSAFNDMCGDYFDLLHVKVGDALCKDIPVRMGVAGTPLVVQKERVLIRGLKARRWRTNLDYGELPVGTDADKTFYVFNTGSLDMHLSWVFQRFLDQDEYDADPDLQLVDISLRTESDGVKLSIDKHSVQDVAPFEIYPREQVGSGSLGVKSSPRLHS